MGGRRENLSIGSSPVCIYNAFRENTSGCDDSRKTTNSFKRDCALRPLIMMKSRKKTVSSSKHKHFVFNMYVPFNPG